MQTIFATSQGDLGKPNEDYASSGPGWAFVLDGATAPAGVDSGCIHDVRWLVRNLAVRIAGGLTLEDKPLPEIAAEAILRTCEAHADTCDLANPDSPSSTVAIVRPRDGLLDYLVLGDTDVIMRRHGEVVPVHDDRTEHLPGGRPYTVDLVRQWRNVPGGFWVAGARPEAAYEALSGSAEGITEVALFTDGVTRLTDWYGWSWQDFFIVLDNMGGPSGLIRRVREAEASKGVPFGKAHDDATALYVTSLTSDAGAPVVPDPLILMR